MNLLTTLTGTVITSLGGVALSDTGVPASYLLMEDHYINNVFLQAGTVVTEGGAIPTGWIPTPNVDPLNLSAVRTFYNIGPRLQGLIRQQWSDVPIRKPVTYWIKVGGFGPGFQPPFIGPQLWQLTGLGSNVGTYPPVQAQL